MYTCVSCFTYSVLLLYWPLSSGGCTPCLQGLTYRVADPSLGFDIAVAVLLCSGALFWYTHLYFIILFSLGYDGGPVPSFDSVCVCLEVCGHVVCVGPYIWFVCHLYMLDSETKPPIWLLSVYVLLLGGRTAAVTLSARIYIYKSLLYMFCDSLGSLLFSFSGG